jgi:hypothetical protein
MVCQKWGFDMSNLQQVRRLPLITNINGSKLAIYMPGGLTTLGLLFFSAFIILIYTIITLARLLSTQPIDPFAAYDAILPGQSIAVLENYDCNSQYDSPETGASFCQIHPQEGAMLLVNVTSQDGIIQNVSFAPNGLRFAEVVLHWGRPDILQKSERHYIARWKAGVYATATSHRPFSFNSPVHTIVLSTSDYCACDLTAFIDN